MRPNLLMWLANWFPASQLVGSVCACIYAEIWWHSLCMCLVILYILPPLLCRILLLWHRPSGTVTLASRSGSVWFCTFQLQVLYGRLPFLEELLRVLPGCYSAWLTLWGSQVSLWTYWAPGTMIADRWLLHIEQGVLVGPRCHIGGHVLVHDDTETKEKGCHLTIGKTTCERGAIIGAKAVLGPGCVVAAGETLPATYPLPPFSRWAGGKRHKPSEPSS